MAARLPFSKFRRLFDRGKNEPLKRAVVKAMWERIHRGRSVQWKREILPLLKKNGLDVDPRAFVRRTGKTKCYESGLEDYLIILYWIYLCRDDDPICQTELERVCNEVWQCSFEARCEQVFAQTPRQDSDHEENEGAFEHAAAGAGPDQSLASPPPRETGPFRWPPHVSREDVLPKKKTFVEDAYAAIWLNPHNHYSIPLSGRDREKELLDEFVRHDSPFLIGAVIAPSGAGKTRLISEWMRPYMAKYQIGHWDAGFVESRDKDLWKEDKWTPERNTLIIIDYTYNYGEIIGEIIDRFRDHAPKKVRLLVLDHVLPDKFHDDFVWKHRYPEQKIREGEIGLFFEPFPIVLEPDKDESMLLRDVIACAADPYSKDKRYKPDDPVVIRAADALMRIGETDKEDPTEDDIRRRNAIRHPLFAALMGQAIYRDPDTDFSNLTRRDLITHYLEGGQRTPWEDNEQNKHAETLGHWVGCYVSAATLLRGVAARDMHAQLPSRVRQTLSKGNQLKALVQYCNRIVSGRGARVIRPFEPDILGEAFFLRFIEAFDADDEVFGAFVSMLSTHKTPELEQIAATNFLETLQRLVRNLINDDQETGAVKDSWAALLDFLTPDRFPDGALMRHAVSIALGDAIKQCQNARLDTLVPVLADQIDLTDLCNGSNGALWQETVFAVLHYYDWVATGGRVGQHDEQALTQILLAFKEQSRAGFPALVLAAYEGCLAACKSIRSILGEALDATQDEGWTALMVAAHMGHEHVVNWLIEAGANVDQRDTVNGWTALTAASTAGHLKVVDRLTKAGAKVNQITLVTGATALMAASHAGHLDVVSHLIKFGARIDQRRGDTGMTALMDASAAGHLEVVDLLIEAGARVNQRRTDTGATALMISSVAGHPDVVDYLIEAGARIDQATTDIGMTVLIAASRAGHPHVVDRLIEAGASVDQEPAGTCVTALMIASAAGHLKVVDRLIEGGARVDYGTTENGWTALMDASVAGHLDVVDRLIEAGATVDQVTSDNGWTALMAASAADKPNVVDRLIEAGARVDRTRSDTGMTALMDASAQGHLDVLDRLIENGADVDQGRIGDGATALMAASHEGHLDVVGRLIEAGANIDQGMTNTGVTALILASVAGHQEIVDRLIEAGTANKQTKASKS